MGPPAMLRGILGQSEGTLVHFGGILAASWGHLEPSWGILRSSWGHPGAFKVYLGDSGLSYCMLPTIYYQQPLLEPPRVRLVSSIFRAGVFLRRAARQGCYLMRALKADRQGMAIQKKSLTPKNYFIRRKIFESPRAR